MVTKGIIQTIDFNGNTCTVRLPYFETASINDPVVLDATLLIIPGVYNGYKPNDVVLVAFEDGQINNPIVIGKLFLGTNKESAESRSAINVANLKVGKEAAIPVDTKLTYAGDDKNRAAVAKDLSTYKTVADIIKSIQTHSEKIGSATAQLIDDGVKLGAKVDKVNDGSTTGFGWELTDSGWAIFARNSDWALRDRLNLMTINSDGTTFFGKVRILDYPIDIETRYIQTDSNTVSPEKPDAEKNKTSWPEGWTAEMPPRQEGKYIWSCTKTVKYIKDPNNPKTLTEQTTYSNPVCLSGVDGNDGKKGDPGIGVHKVIDLFKIVKSSIEDATEVPVPTIEDYSDEIKWNNGWLTSPDAETLKKDETWWTCIATVYTDNKIKYSTPIKNNAYALAQGKSTNYYSDEDPRNNPANILKDGDCWFDTSSKSDENHKTLKQWSANENKWIDIGGELVANKVTANYVNALDITAKKIAVLDKDNNTLFEANGLNKNGTVKIANFTVNHDKLYSNEHSTIDSTGTGIYLGSDGLSIGSGFKVNAGGTPTVAGYTKSVERKYCIAEFNTVPNPAPEWWEDWGSMEWKDNPPNREDGKYIWEWTRTQRTSNDGGDVPNDSKVCITGARGDTGTGVSECKTYYSLSNTTSITGPETGDDNIVDVPVVNKWSTSPLAFNKDLHQGYTYWTVERRVYTNLDNTTNSVIWGTPVKASMLSADFIDALGITAKSIKVLDKDGEMLFDADGIGAADKGGTVTLAGWKATKDSLLGGDEDKGTYTKIRIPDASASTANRLVSSKSLFNIEVIDPTTIVGDSTWLKAYSFVPNDPTQIKERKLTADDHGNYSPLLSRDNYYVWDITPKKMEGEKEEDIKKPHLAIIKLTYNGATTLYNFNIYLSGLFNHSSNEKASPNFIAATQVFREQAGSPDELYLLRMLCCPYTYDTNTGAGEFGNPTKTNPFYVLAMDNTSMFYNGRINYAYPQLNSGEWFYIIQYVQDISAKTVPGTNSTGTGINYNDITMQSGSDNVVRYNRGTFCIERQVDTSKTVFDVSTNFRVSELGNLQSKQSLRAYDTVRAEKIECGSWRFWPERLVKEDFELRSNQIKLATARSAKVYDKATLTMRVRSNVQAEKTTAASEPTYGVLSQGELSCDHALSISGKEYIRFGTSGTVPTKDEEAQMVISKVIPDGVNNWSSMSCAAVVVKKNEHFLGWPGSETAIKQYTDITIRVVGVADDTKLEVSPRYVTVQCLCNNTVYPITGMLGKNRPSFEKTITVDATGIDITDLNQIKFRWSNKGLWDSQSKGTLIEELDAGNNEGMAEIKDPAISTDNVCSHILYIDGEYKRLIKTVGFNSNAIPLTSNKWALGDTNHTWSEVHANTVYTKTGTVSKSDARLKKDIKSLRAEDFSTFYDKLQPVSFKFKTDAENAPVRLGFIAQEVETALTETNHTDLGIVSKPVSKTDYYGLHYEQFIMLNMLQIKQLKKELADLQQKCEMLEKTLVQKNQKGK